VIWWLKSFLEFVFWERGVRVEMSGFVKLLIWGWEMEGRIDRWILFDEFDYREMNGIEAYCQWIQHPIDPGNCHYQE